MLHTLRECVEAGRELAARTREGKPMAFYRTVHDLLESGQIDPMRIALSELFEGFVPDGREALQRMNPRFSHDPLHSFMMEAGDSVDTGAFSNIIGQVTYTTVLNALDSPDLIAMDLVTTSPATTQYPEQLPGIGQLGDQAQETGEGEDYPRVGVSEEWISIPEKLKDGFIVPVTEESIWEDKTGGLLMRRVNAVSESMGITIEKEGLSTILGIDTTYSRNGGPKQPTYAATHTEGDFDNLVPSNELLDETNIEAAMLKFDDINDPNTGEPVMLNGALQIIVPTAKDWTLAKILKATEVRDVQGSSTRLSAPAIADESRGRTFNKISNQYVKTVNGGAEDEWWIGDFRAAFGYREVWPLGVFRMDRNSEAGFGRDVVTQVKIRRKGRFFVEEPRKVVKCTNT